MTKYKVYSPNPAYTGMSAGASFISGVAETDNPASLVWFTEHGYRIEEITEAPTEKKHKEGKGKAFS